MTQPPGSQQPPYGHVVDAPASPYLAPGAYTGYAPPARPTSSTLGWVALVAGAVALIGSAINGLVIGSMLRPEAFDSPDSGNISVLMSLGLANLLIVWFGFGLWAIIQGCVAIAQKRGVGPGIGGLILGVIGPWVGVVVAIAAFMTTFGDV